METSSDNNPQGAQTRSIADEVMLRITTLPDGRPHLGFAHQVYLHGLLAERDEQGELAAALCELLEIAGFVAGREAWDEVTTTLIAIATSYDEEIEIMHAAFRSDVEGEAQEGQRRFVAPEAGELGIEGQGQEAKGDIDLDAMRQVLDRLKAKKKP